MWELLLQMRVLLPYLTRLVPLLDRGLVRAAPDLTDVRDGIGAIQTGSQELSVQLRNQTLKLERMEEQLTALRESADRSLKESRELSRDLEAMAAWVKTLAAVVVVLTLASIAMFVLQMVHSGR